MSIDEWDGPSLDEEIEDLENNGLLVFSSLQEAIDTLKDIGYTVIAPGKMYDEV